MASDMDFLDGYPFLPALEDDLFWVVCQLGLWQSMLLVSAATLTFSADLFKEGPSSILCAAMPETKLPDAHSAALDSTVCPGCHTGILFLFFGWASLFKPTSMLLCL